MPLGALADISTGHPAFDWTNPPAWTDGSTLTAAQITGYQLTCTGVQAVNSRIAAATGVPPTTYPPTTLAALPPGNYSCTMAVYAKQTPTSTEQLGVASAPVSFTVPQPRPGVITGLSAN